MGTKQEWDPTEMEVLRKGDPIGMVALQEWGPYRNGDPTGMKTLRKGDPIGMVTPQEWGPYRNGDPTRMGTLQEWETLMRKKFWTNFGVCSYAIQESALSECDAKSLVKWLHTFFTESR